MNLLEAPVLMFVKTAAEIAVEGRAKVVNTWRLLAVTAALPIVLAVLGIVCGRWGDWLGWDSLVSAGSFLVIAAALVGSALWALLWARAAVYANLFWLATRAASSFKEGFPQIDKKELQELVWWSRSVTTWLTAGFALIVVLHRFDPVWRHLELLSVLLVLALILAGAASSMWFTTFWGRYVLYGVGLAAFVFSVASYVSPALAEGADRLVGRHLGRGELSAVTEARRLEAMRLDRDLLDKLYAEVNDLRRRGIETCGGKFCDGDEEKVAELEERIARLKNGTYWETEKPSGSPEPGADVRPDPAPASTSPASGNAPPAKPAKATPKSRATPPAEPPRSSGKISGGGVWDELSKYPDIR